MDRALNKVTNEIWYAAKLKKEGDEYVNRHKQNFECPNVYCNGNAEPVACLSMRQVGVNKFQPYKQPPHFRIKNHIPNCIYSDEHGGKGRVDAKGNYTWVLPYVEEITTPHSKKKDKQHQKNPSSTTLKNKQASKSNSGSSSSSGSHPQRTNYVSGAAHYYIQSTEEAKDKDLTIFGYTRKYHQYFQELGWFKDSRYIDNHIFYKALKFTQQPIIKDDLIIVTLYQIEPNSRKQFEVHLNTSDWSPRDKEGCKLEIQLAIEAAKNRSAFTTAFFIGCQDRNEKHIFHCDYSEFFCIYMGEEFSLPANNRGVKKDKIKLKGPSVVKPETLSSTSLKSSYAREPTESESLVIETSIATNNDSSFQSQQSDLMVNGHENTHFASVVDEKQEPFEPIVDQTAKLSEPTTKPLITERKQTRVVNESKATSPQKPGKQGVLSTFTSKIKAILGFS